MGDQRPGRSLRRNVEIKVRVESLSPLRTAAERIAAQRLGRWRQIDTYFHTRHGRLKLRRSEDGHAELIWYSRPDSPSPKPSDYRRVPVEHAEAVETALAEAWGVWIVVDKLREVFLYQNVRIHLDEVSGLGPFLELEAMLDSPEEEPLGRIRLSFLLGELGCSESGWEAGSYSDLLASSPYNCGRPDAALDC